MIPLGVSKACLQLLAIDDEIVEDSEFFTLVIGVGDKNDVVNSSASIIIFDNDGRYNIVFILSCFKIPTNISTGVNLRVNGSLYLFEGGMQQICLMVENPELLRERTIPISFFVVSHNANDGGKCIKLLVYNSCHQCIQCMQLKVNTT